MNWARRTALAELDREILSIQRDLSMLRSARAILARRRASPATDATDEPRGTAVDEQRWEWEGGR